MSARRLYQFNGKIQTVTEWAIELKISRDALFQRLRQGWSIERALTTPTVSRKECGLRGSNVTRLRSIWRN